MRPGLDLKQIMARLENPKKIRVRLDGPRPLSQGSSNPLQAEDLTVEEFYQYIKARLAKESPG